MRQRKKNGSHAKVIAGASGTWQYNYAPEKIDEYGLYAILEGETRRNCTRDRRTRW